jgi:hypothetical protein
MLAQIFVAAVQELTGDDYTEAQQKHGPPRPRMRMRSARSSRVS